MAIVKLLDHNLRVRQGLLAKALPFGYSLIVHQSPKGY
jgi:hypothetical protein